MLAARTRRTAPSTVAAVIAAVLLAMIPFSQLFFGAQAQDKPSGKTFRNSISMDFSRIEPGILLSSRNHYTFNLRWLEQNAGSLR